MVAHGRESGVGTQDSGVGIQESGVGIQESGVGIRLSGQRSPRRRALRPLFRARRLATCLGGDRDHPRRSHRARVSPDGSAPGCLCPPGRQAASYGVPDLLPTRRRQPHWGRRFRAEASVFGPLPLGRRPAGLPQARMLRLCLRRLPAGDAISGFRGYGVMGH